MSRGGWRALPRRGGNGPQFSARVPSGRTPPATSSAVASWSAVSATRWVNGPVETRATPSSSSSRTGSDLPGHADHAELLRPEPVDERLDLLAGDDAGHEDDRRADLEEGPAAADRLGDELAPVGAGLGTDEGVGAGVEHEVDPGVPAGARARPRRRRPPRRAASSGPRGCRRRRRCRSPGGRSPPGRRSRPRSPSSPAGPPPRRSARPCRGAG